MKLEKISIKNYRSILASESFSLSDYSVLIGKNNEGKSNILNAINMAFQAFRDPSILRGYDGSPRLLYRRIYNFDVDYPIDLQGKDSFYIESHPTAVSLTFSFNDIEQKEFFKVTGLTYNAPLEIRLDFASTSVSMSVSRRRDDEKQSKAKAIAAFIAENYGVIYIPTIRTSEQSLRIIEQIVNNGLSSLRRDEDYQKAYQLIWEREQAKLNEISSNLKPIMQTFVPTVKDITLNHGRPSFRTVRRDIDFIIDDGNVTSIDRKGDGIKSLVQIALLKETSGIDAGLIMIEEPESHLHSGAIHALFKVLQDISKKQQIIVTTHNPIFVNVSHIESNHIVSDRKCYPITSLREVRDTLGIQFSDSLFSSEYVVVVEGESDKKVFSHLLSLVSASFKGYIESGTISFIVTKGASKTSSFLSFMDQMLIQYFAIWDNDQAGQDALEKCSQASLIETNYRMIPTLSKNNAVLEDLLNPQITIGHINQKYGCNIGFNMGKAKWSDYVLRKLKEIGVQINSSDLEVHKNAIADIVLTRDSIDDIISVEPYKRFVSELANSILMHFRLSNT